MNESNEADQKEEQEDLNVGNPPKKNDIAEYLKNISEQCMLQAYKTQSFPTIKFEVGQITQNANPISTTPNNVMTFALPERYDENEARQKIMAHCRNGVTLKDRSNNGTEYTVKLEQTDFDTIDEAAQKARELNVEDEENYRRAILFDETPMFLKVVGYNSKYNKVEKTDQSDFPEDLDDSTQDTDYDDPEELQKNKYIAGILYGMHNGLDQNALTNGVPQFQIEKPATEDNPDLETIALYGLSLRLNTVFGYDQFSPLSARKSRYQKIYNKLILQGYENKDVIKLIAKMDLAYQYDNLNNSIGQLSSDLSSIRSSIEEHILSSNDTNLNSLQNLDDIITQKLREKSKSIYETFYPAYKKISTHIMNKINQNEVAQLPDMDNSYLIPQSHPILVNINSVPIIPMNDQYNYANVGNDGQPLQSNFNINYNEMNSKYPQQYKSSNQGPVPVYTPITTTNNPPQTTITYNPNDQEFADNDNAIITEAGQNYYNNQNIQLPAETTITTTTNTDTQNLVTDSFGNLKIQEDNAATNNINVTRALNYQLSHDLNQNNNIQTNMTSTPIVTNNSISLTPTIIQPKTITYTNDIAQRSNNIIFGNQYMKPNNTFSQNNHINAFATETQLDSDSL